MNDTQWYKRWFNQNYLHLYAHRNLQDAETHYRLILDTINPGQTDFILDLGCGTGRYVHLFHRDGYRIAGMDLSRVLIESGRKKYRGLDWILGDMRHVPGRFDIILSLFTSFGYFESPDEDEGVVRSVVSSLSPGGIFWLDFLNRDQVINNLVPRSQSRLPDGTVFVERRKICDNRIIKEIHIRSEKGEETYMESVFLYSRKDLEGMFRRCGLNVERCFGNYSGDRYDSGSDRLILMGKKNG